MQCVAIARSTGKRCGNEAAPGSPFCEVVQHNDRHPIAPGAEGELERARAARGAPGPGEGLEAGQGPAGAELEEELEAAAPAQGPDPGPLEGSSSRASSSEPRRADFSLEGDPYPSGLEGIPEGPEPEEEDVARPRPGPERDLDKLDRVSPHLFHEARREAELEGEELEEELRGIPEEPDTPRARPGVPGPHSSRQIGRIVLPAIDRTLRAAGLEELEPEEASSGSEIIALWLNHHWETLDPDNPNHMLSMWAVVVIGSRLAPRAVASVAGKARARMGGGASDNGAAPSSASSSSSSGDAAEPARGGEGPEEEAGSSWLGGQIR